MHQNDPDVDQRLFRFEAQLDRFSLALQQWQHIQEHAQSGAGNAGTPGSAGNIDQRVRTLEETLDRETDALRRMHEEPLKQLHAQAASLKEICAAAATSVNGLDQAQSRLAALQSDVHLHLSELSLNLQALVADLRLGTSSAMATQGPPPATWPLDRVVHLHDELRRGGNGWDGATTPPNGTAGNAKTMFQSHAAAAAPTAEEPASTALAVQRYPWYLAGALVAIAALAIFFLERRIETRLNDAGARVTAAERQVAATNELANREIAASRQEASRQVVAARQSAERAETIGAILTAPDLVRFNLTGASAVERPAGQLLWSRTRGLVLSASRLPPAPPETTYQLWLTTSTEPVSAALFVPDATGRATVVTDVPPNVGRPVVGAEVTIEPSGGRAAPSGRVLLVRAPAS
jgi:anti-sigma-K factor RskA